MKCGAQIPNYYNEIFFLIFKQQKLAANSRENVIAKKETANLKSFK